MTEAMQSQESAKEPHVVKRLQNRMESSFYTVQQFADLLSVHYQTIIRYCETGKVHAVKLGRVWRIPREELSEFTGRLRQRMKR